MMNRKESKSTVLESHFLTSQEKMTCKKVATGEAPHSLRALALLAMDEGSNQAQAAERAGLSAGQVKYLKSRFRKQRMDIFPQAVLGDSTGTAKSPESIAEKKAASAAKTNKAKAKIQKKPKSKTKQDKKSKKTNQVRKQIKKVVRKAVRKAVKKELRKTKKR